MARGLFVHFSLSKQTELSRESGMRISIPPVPASFFFIFVNTPLLALHK